MIKNLLSLMFVFTMATLNGQDLIVKKDSTEIYCKIIYVNLKSVYYTVSNDPKEIKIDKSEVIKYVFDWHHIEQPKTTLTPTLASPKTTTTSTASELITLFATGGISIPTGDFGSSDYKNDKSGFATPGIFGHFGVGLKLNKNCRVICSYLYQNNNFDVSTYDYSLQSIYPGNQFSSKSANWISYGFMGGLLCNIPMDAQKKLNALIDLEVGKPNFDSPNIETTVTSFYYGTINNSSITMESSNTKALAYLIGLGINYQLIEELSLTCTVNVFDSKPLFTGVVTKTNTGFSSKDDFYQQINTTMLKLGIVIKLN